MTIARLHVDHRQLDGEHRQLRAVEGGLPPRFDLQPIDEFAQVDEPGAAALVGTAEEALVGANSDVMFYGDGGAGKTTMSVDLGFHLAAGDDWLGIEVPKPLRVALVEAEGSRGMFRRKVRRKLDGWNGSPIEGRLFVLSEPWGALALTDQVARQALAAELKAKQIDLLIIGPLTAIGMDTPGTIAEARAFVQQTLEPIRRLLDRPIAFLIVHHESKGGKVSGAWEGVGDTLMHLQAHGHGKAALHLQKVRNSSELHGTTIKLVWGEGATFLIDPTVAEPTRPERTWDDIAAYVLAHGGCGWNEVDSVVSGKSDYLRRRRTEMLAEGVLINVGSGQSFELWHRDDPSRPTLDGTASPEGRSWDAVASGTGTTARTGPRPRVPPLRGTRLGTQSVPRPPTTSRQTPRRPAPSGRKERDHDASRARPLEAVSSCQQPLPPRRLPRLRLRPRTRCGRHRRAGRRHRRRVGARAGTRASRLAGDRTRGAREVVTRLVTAGEIPDPGGGEGVDRWPPGSKTPKPPALQPPDVIGRMKGTRPCEWCGEPIDPATTKSGRARFCGPYCRWKHIDANRPPDLSRSDPEYRARKLAAAKEHQWTRRCIRCGEPTWSQHSPFCQPHSEEAALRRAARTRSAKEKPKTAAQIRRARDRERLRKRTRPTPKERGYGEAFKKEKKRVAKIVRAGTVCVRCGEPIRVIDGKPEAWDLGHSDVDRTLIAGPEHRACNRGTAAHAARRRRRNKAKRKRRDWAARERKHG